MEKIKIFYRSAYLVVNDKNEVHDYLDFEGRIIVSEKLATAVFSTPFIDVYDLQKNCLYLVSAKLINGKRLPPTEITIPAANKDEIKFLGYENDLAYGYPEYHGEYDAYSGMNWTLLGRIKPQKSYARLNGKMFFNLKINEMSVVNGALKVVCGSGSEAIVIYYRKVNGKYHSVSEEEVCQQQTVASEIQILPERKSSKLPKGFLYADEVFSNSDILK